MHKYTAMPRVIRPNETFLEKMGPSLTKLWLIFFMQTIYPTETINNLPFKTNSPKG